MSDDPISDYARSTAERLRGLDYEELKARRDSWRKTIQELAPEFEREAFNVRPAIKVERHGRELTLSSGRTVEVLGSIIGLSLDPDPLQPDYAKSHDIHVGADDDIQTGVYGALKEHQHDFSPWTPEERAEFAEFMSARWLAWGRR